MKLSELELPVAYEWGVAHALVFAEDLAVRIADVHAQHGDPRHVPSPRMLSDGRYALTADILTECLPGGLMYAGFSHLDATKFDEVDVMPIADALALLPPEE